MAVLTFSFAVREIGGVVDAIVNFSQRCSVNGVIEQRNLRKEESVS